MNTEIMQKSLQWYNFQAMKKQENLKAILDCQMYSDTTELNKLDFTPMPAIPEFESKVERVPLTAGLYNLVRQMLP